MALPSAYLTSFRNVDAILAAIRAAQAPQRFTQKFLEGLGFQNSNDRLFINMFKALGFVNDTGIPTKRYHEYLDQTQSERIMAAAVREAYGDLFQINTRAQEMSANDVKNKMKTLSEGQFSERVLTQMAGTFKAFAKNADFVAVAPGPGTPLEVHREKLPSKEGALAIRGLVYNINLHLPESRDQAVYDALFKALREHLVG
jgi:hypothetical protein